MELPASPAAIKSVVLTFWDVRAQSLTPLLSSAESERSLGDAGVTNATWGEADSQVAGPSQFWVAGRNVPEPNEDTLRIAPVFQYLPQQFKDATWTAEETKCLTEALLKAAQARLHGSLCLQQRSMQARKPLNVLAAWLLQL